MRQAYVGRLDVLNALWWKSHPADAAPDGTPSLLNGLRDLQHRVFSANGGSAGDPDAALAIRALEAEISAEREAITAAVVIAQAEPEGQGLHSLFPADRVGDTG